MDNMCTAKETGYTVLFKPEMCLEHATTSTHGQPREITHIQRLYCAASHVVITYFKMNQLAQKRSSERMCLQLHLMWVTQYFACLEYGMKHSYAK